MQHILAREAALKARVKELESGHAEYAAALIDKLEDLELLPNAMEAHEEADKLVSKFLRDLGQTEAANAWDAAREGWFYG